MKILPFSPVESCTPQELSDAAIAVSRGELEVVACQFHEPEQAVQRRPTLYAKLRSPLGRAGLYGSMTNTTRLPRVDPGYIRPLHDDPLRPGAVDVHYTHQGEYEVVITSGHPEFGEETPDSPVLPYTPLGVSINGFQISRAYKVRGNAGSVVLWGVNPETNTSGLAHQFTTIGHEKRDSSVRMYRPRGL